MSTSEIRETPAKNTEEKSVEEILENEEKRLEIELTTSAVLNTQYVNNADEILNENGDTSVVFFQVLRNDLFVNENAPEIMEFEICDTPEENSIEEYFYENNAELELVTSHLLNAQNINNTSETLVEETLNESWHKFSELESPTSQRLNFQNVNIANDQLLEEILNENELPEIVAFEEWDSQDATEDVNNSYGDSIEEIINEIPNEAELELVTSHETVIENELVVLTNSDLCEHLDGSKNESGTILPEICAATQSKGKVGENFLVTSNENDDMLPELEFAAYLKTTHKNKIYGVQFYNDLTKEPFIFATVGGNNVTIYECTQDDIKPLKTYIDPNENEIFYTCCWSHNPLTLKAILAFAGFHGIIKVVYPMSMSPTQVYFGHSRSINHLKIHPKDPSILLSASEDHTLRLWNIESGQCIAIFGGVNGHKDQVVNADFDSTGSRIVSCGVDNSLKIWRLDGSPIKELIQHSFSDQSGSERPNKIFQCHFPEFTTRDIHKGIVDCVKWHGNLILSKSTENAIICWAPGSFMKISSLMKVEYATVIHRFEIYDCNYWYIRFSVDSAEKYLAIGNNVGETFVWSLDCENPTKCTILKHEQCTATIRETAFSPDGQILICVCDDNTLFRWNMK